MADYAMRGMSPPIPGQSLTAQPGSRPYEKPPRFSKPEEAMEFFFDRITERKQAIRLVALMENGLSVQNVVMSLLMGAFTEGFITPDVGIIISEPLTQLVILIAKKAGIEPEIGGGDDSIDDVLMGLAEKNSDSEMEDAVMPANIPESQVKEAGPALSGLMSPLEG